MPITTRRFVGWAGLIFILGAAGSASAGPLDAPGATKALVCSACHGFAGNSPSDTMPILAGMQPTFFTKAIQDYASGKRPSPEMEPFAKMVLQMGVGDVVAYFASQKRQPTPIRLDPATVALGRAASVQCVICHGPEGKGDPSRFIAIPDLTGQPPGYLKNQMLLFKAERRSPGDETLKALKALMREIPDETFSDLAAYYSSLR